MIGTRILLNSKNFYPCNAYFCKCIEYLNPGKKKDFKFYEHCYRTNIKENYPVKISWEEQLVRARLIKK